MTKTYNIEVDCANCANLCEVEANKIEGVASATINFWAQKMTVEFADGADERKVMKMVLKVCRKVEPDFDIN
jgi:copper chaperone CopZ